MGRRVAAAVLALAALAGCSSNSGSTTAVAPGAAQEAKPGAGDPDAAAKAPEDKRAAAEPATSNRQLVRIGSVRLQAPDVAGTAARVNDVVLAQGGYVASENLTDNNATTTLRVPGDRLDAVMKAVGELPDVRVAERTVRTEDVTDQVVDVEARIANQRASVERVRALLDRATTTAEITQIESELTRRQGELESLLRRHDTLKGQAAMSTLTVAIGRTDRAPAAPAEDDDFLTALAGGWHALTAALGWLLIVIGRVLPFAVVLGAPLLGYLAWRRRRKGAVTP
ncbi:DUF4349 domain-containing protein [Saccharothrix obliqua]|uniref:DUF4349 domain-containing protein n=1 Tax=Saccharothrix obliqua TaxID=2861747 RepID=UPI001C6044F8|nr:DUF4349 domain-containing protein [Saccharothrix obliqua]MBW4715822.1 DUF4349 domain-containing protein [Saccharothrix obliqua]